ncbi:MAG: PqqD family protein [Deltaproteobacteria bacterium]|jgi:hypothetical protein|nr:PqqD family protein [Deltaproteobacteria bacterium]
MPELSPSLVIRPGLAWDAFPDEVVAIDVERGLYFNLTDAGAELFAAFAEPCSPADALATLLVTFEPGPTFEADVAALIAELVTQGLLVPAEGPSNPPRPKAPPAARRVPKSLALERHEDLQDLLVIDPVHEATDEGWPARRPD